MVVSEWVDRWVVYDERAVVVGRCDGVSSSRVDHSLLGTLVEIAGGCGRCVACG